MRLSRVRIVVYAFLLSSAALWFNAQQSGNSQLDANQIKAKQTYSWQSTESTTWQIDRQQPDQQTTIKTDTWRYQETSKQSHFTQPVITLINDHNVTTITSQQGQSQNDNIISLSGDVVMTQKSDSATPNQTQLSTLKTDQITYNASQGELSSSDSITINHPSGTTTGQGLKANLQSGSYHLLSNVKGTYHTESE